MFCLHYLPLSSLFRTHSFTHTHPMSSFSLALPSSIPFSSLFRFIASLFLPSSLYLSSICQSQHRMVWPWASSSGRGNKRISKNLPLKRSPNFDLFSKRFPLSLNYLVLSSSCWIFYLSACIFIIFLPFCKLDSSPFFSPEAYVKTQLDQVGRLPSVILIGPRGRSGTGATAFARGYVFLRLLTFRLTLFLRCLLRSFSLFLSLTDTIDSESSQLDGVCVRRGMRSVPHLFQTSSSLFHRFLVFSFQRCQMLSNLTSS